MHMDNNMAQNLLSQALELWITPEIEKRQKDGTLENDFVLSGAQVLFNLKSGKPQVRLNEEIKADLIGTAKREIQPGESAPIESMLQDIHNLRLTEHDDPDVGHLTLFLFQDKWHIFFDFRYNKSKIKKIFDAGKEFFGVAKLTLEKSMYRAFVDNLYSAVELFATCQIYNMAGDAFQRKRRHRTIHRKYNEIVNIGNFKTQYKTTLNKLAELRLSARYLKEDFSIDDVDVTELSQIGEDMLAFTKKMCIDDI